MNEIRFDAHGEAAAIGEIDVSEYEFADGDTLLVQNELYKLMWDNHVFRNMVEELYDHVTEEKWTGVGVITNADGSLFHAGVTKDDYGRHTVGNGHLCEVAILASNGQSIEYGLTEADKRDRRAEREAAELRALENEGLDAIQAAGVLALQREYGTVHELKGFKERERWFEGTEAVYLYDLGATHIAAEVRSIERSLADYPILDEDGHSELEDDMWLDVFHSTLPRLDSSIDSEELEDEFRGENDTRCPECGWTKDITDFLEESEDYSECDDCGDWFDVEADGAEHTPHPLCPSCGEDYRVRQDEASEKCEDEFGFNPATGAGLVIRWNDGYYYFWNRNSQKWEPQMRMKDTYVVNE